jgi:ferritin-like metal-binding protein YciE
MEERTLRLFEHGIRDMYDAEHKLVGVLERQARDTTDETLRDGFRRHRKVTQQQISRLEEIFQILERSARREPCEGINGLIEEYSKFVRDENPDPQTLDVFSAGAARKVELYEIAAYSTLIDLAQVLNLREAVDLLEESRREEVETAGELEAISKKLSTQLAGAPEGVVRHAAEVVGENVRQGALVAVGAADVMRSRASDLMETAGDVVARSERRGERLLEGSSGTARSRSTNRRTSPSSRKKATKPSSRKTTKKSSSARTGSRKTTKGARSTGSRAGRTSTSTTRSSPGRKTSASRKTSGGGSKTSGAKRSASARSRTTSARKSTRTR